MSHPQAPQRQPTPSETVNYAKVLHNTALITAVACPLLALLPPRKLDVFTLTLGGTTVFSVNYLTRESTGRSILQHLSGSRPPVLTSPYAKPDEPQMRVSETVRLETQEALRASRERTGFNGQTDTGKQAKDWKHERDQEVVDAIEEGKGFGDMIMDQVYEVWNWGKKRDEEED